MMLGHDEIIRQIGKNHIYIERFYMDQLGPNSYDVTMGNWVVEEKESTQILNLRLPSSVEEMWQQPRQLRNEEDFIVVPGAFFLTHTNEIIGSHKYATLLKARSTLARCGLDICASAGFGDVGFVNRWTLEIKNNSRNHIALRPGMRIAQISFQEVKGASQYQGAYKLEHVHEWKPEDMLPVLGLGRV